MGFAPALWSLGFGSARPVAQTGTLAALGAVEENLLSQKHLCGSTVSHLTVVFFLIVAEGRLPGAGGDQLQRLSDS